MIRTRQPQGAVRVDWGNPITKGLRRAIIPTSGWYGTDVVGNASYSAFYGGSTPAKIAPDSIGLCFLQHRALYNQCLQVATWTNVTSEASLLIIRRGAGTILCQASTAKDEFPFSGLAYCQSFWTSRWMSGVAAPSGNSFSGANTIIHSVKNGSQKSFWNGIEWHSSTATGGFSLPATVSFGCDASGETNGQCNIALALLFDRALSSAEATSLSLNPWQIFAPSRRVWVQLGAASTVDTYALTANSLTDAAPTLGTPALTEQAGTNVALTASSLTGSTPTLGSPVLAQNHVVTSNNLTGAAPTLGTSAVTQNHVVTAGNLVGASPTEGQPTLSQNHVVTATGLAGSSPTLGTPALSIQAGDTWNLLASGITGSAPTEGTPALAQNHVVVASGLTATSPVLGTPALSQNHVITAAGLTGSSPILGSPAILSDTYALTADNLVGSAAILANPEIVVDISVLPPSFQTASGGGGGASIKRWMKESGIDDEIDELARQRGLAIPRQRAKAKDVVEEVVEEAVEEALPEIAETVQAAVQPDFSALEARLDQMEERIMRQLRRRDEEYFIWRAIAERVL
jgi:hypothetical protein